MIGTDRIYKDIIAWPAGKQKRDSVQHNGEDNLTCTAEYVAHTPVPQLSNDTPRLGRSIGKFPNFPKSDRNKKRDRAGKTLLNMEFKNKGNDALKAKDYAEAIKCYTQAIDSGEDADSLHVFHGNHTSVLARLAVPLWCLG